jgi:hypothetical protein
MGVEWVAVPAGLLGGTMFLLALYQLACRKALRSGERPTRTFVRCLAFLALVHGLGLVSTAVLLVCVPVFFGPLPAEERAWMTRFTLTGFAFVVPGAIILRRTGWFPRAKRTGGAMSHARGPGQ